MMAYSILLSCAIFGLLLLFVLKAVELRGRKVPLLVRLREAGDPFVTRHTERTLRFFHHDAHTFLRTSLLWCRGRLAEAEVKALATAHGVSTRIHERLMRRRAHVSTDNTQVSEHLKNVLEYKKETPPKE